MRISRYESSNVSAGTRSPGYFRSVKRVNMAEQYVLITGATSGIGYELANVFAENGYHLVISARDEGALQKTAAGLSGKYRVNVVPVAKDLFRRQAPFELYEEISGKGITLDILVNNAGQGLYGRFVDTDIQRELDMLQLNMGACIVLTKLFLRDAVTRRRGKILNVSSIAGKVPGPYQAVYHATKAFIHSFTEAVRAEVDGLGITITSLLPGPTDTDFFHKAHMENLKILDGKLENPAKVARDGFNALMDGEDMIISGAKNKAQVMMSKFTSDSAAAKMTLRQQQPRTQSG